MLKISVKGDEPQTKLLVEGRLAGPWVDELERSWQTERQRAPSESILVRLANVTFIDDAGKDMLTRIFQAGTNLEGSGCMGRALTAQLTGGPFPSEACEETKKTVGAQSGGGQGK